MTSWRTSGGTWGRFATCPDQPGRLETCPTRRDGAISFWQWLAIGLAAVGLGFLLWGLDRLGLWLEARGWLYYRKKQPTSSPMSALFALQKVIEPQVEHVIVAKDQKRRDAGSDGLVLANLRDALRATPVNREAIRAYLEAADRQGLDWRRLYNEAVHAELTQRPDRAAFILPLEEVAPRD
jgi:hypothetical protein